MIVVRKQQKVIRGETVEKKVTKVELRRLCLAVVRAHEAQNDKAESLAQERVLRAVAKMSRADAQGVLREFRGSC